MPERPNCGCTVCGVHKHPMQDMSGSVWSQVQHVHNKDMLHMHPGLPSPGQNVHRYRDVTISPIVCACPTLVYQPILALSWLRNDTDNARSIVYATVACGGDVGLMYHVRSFTTVSRTPMLPSISLPGNPKDVTYPDKDGPIHVKRSTPRQLSNPHHNDCFRACLIVPFTMRSLLYVQGQSVRLGGVCRHGGCAVYKLQPHIWIRLLSVHQRQVRKMRHRKLLAV